MHGLIATHRKLWAGQARRMVILKWLLCVATLSAMAVTPRLWTTDRAYPTVPVLDGVPVLPQVLCIAITFSLILSVMAIAVVPDPGAWTLAPPTFGFTLALFDINRLQPWMYQYLLMFTAMALVQWENLGSARSRAARACCGLIVLSIYFWSGLHKLNLTFAREVFPFLLHPFGNGVVAALQRFWFLAPIFETSVGLLLLSPRTRGAGLAGSVAMHSFLLYSLGPLGQNYNSSVWPWNLWMAALATCLFYRNGEQIFGSLWPTPFGKALLVLVGILPVLNFFNRWDGFLAFSYYSGKLRDGWIYLNQRGVDHLPAEYKVGNHAFSLDSPGRYRLDITDWAMSVANIPPYAEPRVYVAIVKQLIEAGVPRDDIVLIIRDDPGLKSSDRTYSQVPIP